MHRSQYDCCWSMFSFNDRTQCIGAPSARCHNISQKIRNHFLEIEREFDSLFVIVSREQYQSWISYVIRLWRGNFSWFQFPISFRNGEKNIVRCLFGFGDVTDDRCRHFSLFGVGDCATQWQLDIQLLLLLEQVHIRHLNSPLKPLTVDCFVFIWAAVANSGYNEVLLNEYFFSRFNFLWDFVAHFISLIRFIEFPMK